MVKLRKKKLASGRISLYLDIYINGKRYYEFLKLQLINNGTNNKETLKLAETIRAKRQIELQCEQYGIISDSRKKINLIQYQIFVHKYKTVPVSLIPLQKQIFNSDGRICKFNSR